MSKTAADLIQACETGPLEKQAEFPDLAAAAELLESGRQR